MSQRWAAFPFSALCYSLLHTRVAGAHQETPAVRPSVPGGREPYQSRWMGPELFGYKTCSPSLL